MRNVVMQPWLMRLTRKESSVNMIGPVRPRIFSEGDLVLVYDQDKDPLGAGKFKPMWFRPFIVKEVLKKGAYRLVDLREMLWRSLEMGSTSRSITHRWVALGDFLYICIVLIQLVFLSFCFMDVSLFMSSFFCGRCQVNQRCSLGSRMVLADTLGGLLPQLG
jgi:hypothetical protein